MAKLHEKFFLGYLAMVLITLLFIIIAFPFLITNDFYKGGKEKMHIMMDKTIDIFNLGIANNQPLQEIVDEVYQKTQFDPYTEIIIFDEKERLLFEEHVNKYNKFFDLNFILTTNFISMTKNKSDIQQVIYNKQRYFAYSIKLSQTRYPNEMILGFAKTTEFYTSSTGGIMRILAMLFIIVFLGGIVASFITAKRISQPIKDLAQYAVSIGEGQIYDFKPKKASDEIYLLYKYMKEMEARLKEASQNQKKYFNMASHELKTPLMKIQGYGEGLANGLPLDVQKTASIIVNETKLLDRIVGQLLLLSKIEDINIQYDIEAIDVNEFIESLLESYRGVCRDKIHFDRSQTENPIILASEELLHQAIDNPISNALRYAKTFINIEVNIDQLYNNVIITISDDGGGIKPEHMPYVFDNFFKDEKGSIGLGMSIMKSSIESMNGFIHIKNSEYGLVVEIHIPLKTEK